MSPGERGGERGGERPTGSSHTLQPSNTLFPPPQPCPTLVSVSVGIRSFLSLQYTFCHIFRWESSVQKASKCDWCEDLYGGVRVGNTSGSFCFITGKAAPQSKKNRGGGPATGSNRRKKEIQLESPEQLDFFFRVRTTEYLLIEI